MALYVIADLHLSLSSDKPMDVFGGNWEAHTEKIKKNWCDTVKDTDTVVIPGDISWGMNFNNTHADLSFVNSLPGKKIIGKGNHDYWWQTMNKLVNYSASNNFDTLNFLFNNAYDAENYIICGTRGWMLDENYSEDDEKIVLREAGRLKFSLEYGEKLKQENPEKEILVFLHYPPAYNGIICEPIAEVLDSYNIKRCWYGHLHSVRSDLLESYVNNTRLYCISADYIGFKPMRII